MSEEKINSTLKELSKVGKLFFYGSTVYLYYKKRKIKLYKILTDINPAYLCQIVPNLIFSKNLEYDCYAKFDNNSYLVFLIKEFDIKNDFEYLKKVYEENKNILFSFFYKPETDRFFTLDKNIFSILKEPVKEEINLNVISLEEKIDLAFLCSEIDVDLSYRVNSSNSNEHIDIDRITALLPFIELILTSRHPHKALLLLNQLEILDKIFPFLKDLKGVEQDRFLHPEGDVYQHTINCFHSLKNPNLRLSYGLLLHDYGKSETKTNKGFHGHSIAGSKKVKKFLTPFGYDNKFISDIEFLVEYHMVNAYFNKLTDEQKNRLFNNELGLDLLKLFKADLLGSIGRLDSYLDIISDLKRIQNKSYRIAIFNELTS